MKEDTSGFPLYLGKDNIVVMVPLLSLRFVFTNPLHFLRRKERGNKLAWNLHYLCLKPFQIWPKHGANGVKMKNKLKSKQTHRQRGLVGNIKAYEGTAASIFRVELYISFLRHADKLPSHYTASRLKWKKLVSVRASNRIHTTQFAPSAFTYPDRVAENIIFRLYKMSSGNYKDT